MLLILRKGLFVLLVILYFFLTPYVILYALGYKIQPAEGEVYKTGLISVVTEPRDAFIYVGGKKYVHKTPTTIRGLRQGDYTVRLQRKGYDSWQKEIPVIQERAARLEPIILLPAKPQIEVLSEQSYFDLIPEASDLRIYALRDPNPNSLRRIDLLFKREIPEREKMEDLNQKKAKSEALLKENPEIKAFLAQHPDEQFEMEVLKRDLFQKDVFLLLSKQGDLWINLTPLAPVGKKVRGYEYAKRGEENKLLFWTARQLSILNYGQHSDFLTEALPVQKEIYNQGTDIRQAFWAYEDSHVLFLDGNRLMLLETAEPGPHQVRLITEVAPGSRVIYNERNHTLYYLENPSRRIVKRKITE